MTVLKADEHKEFDVLQDVFFKPFLLKSCSDGSSTVGRVWAQRAITLYKPGFYSLVFTNAVLIALLASMLFVPGCDFDSTGTNGEKEAVCGNGIIEGDEECDDGNRYPGDGCSSNCKVEPGWECRGEPSVCTPICGDGIIVRGREFCDDGNTEPGDGCSADCRIESGWECSGEPSVCTPICGDGLVVGELECDDGNKVPGDGCSPECTIEPGWDCYGTPSSCYPICGNGLVVGGLECDDENNEPGDGCSADCRIEPGWECSGEPSVCTPVCGDGIITGGQECDDANNEPGDGCSPECTVEPGWYCYGQPSLCYTICGDGIVAGDEECDDGNTLYGDGCSAFCEIEPYYYCDGEPSQCNCRVLVRNHSPISIADGDTWDTAYDNVQAGINRAAAIIDASPNVDTCEVWVGEGEYFVRKTSANDTVRLASNVAVYGGFEGTEATLEQRDPYVFETILNGRESPVNQNRVNHVVTANNTQNAIIDGFTIRSGFTSDEGAGLRAIDAAGLHVENCTFENNEADDGGGVYLSDVSAAFLNCGFYGNIASSNHGGGIFARNSDLHITGSVFKNNDADSYGGGVYTIGQSGSTGISDSSFGPDNTADRGGGLFLQSGEILISNSFFIENSTSGYGGGVHIEETSSVEWAAVIENSVFAGNTSNRGGGLYLFRSNSGLVTVVNSLFFENHASNTGGGIRNYGGSCIVANTILWHNDSNQIANSGTITVRYSNIEGGYGGPGNINEDPMFVDPGDGNFRLQAGSPCIDAADGDWAPEFDLDGNPRVDDPATENTGTGTPNYADIGPYEYQP